MVGQQNQRGCIEAHNHDYLTFKASTMSRGSPAVAQERLCLGLSAWGQIMARLADQVHGAVEL